MSEKKYPTRMHEVSAVNRFSSYDGKRLSEFEHIPARSYYCHNYYKGFGNDILYAESDDDNRTDYKLNGDDRWFAESLKSDGDTIRVFPEHLIGYFV